MSTYCSIERLASVCLTSDLLHYILIYLCIFSPQFVMMKPLLTALPFILRLWVELDYDGRPPILNRVINPYSPKLYIQLAENISVAVAFYALLSFFHGTEKDLAWCDPWPKFLCIKG